MSFGALIEAQELVVPDHLKVAWFCYREAAEVHKHPGGTGRLAWCYDTGRGVTEDPAPAVVLFQTAADLGDAGSKVALAGFLVDGYPRAGVAKDAARGFDLLREADDQGNNLALYFVAECYLKGKGVEKDAVHGVSLMRQVINREDATRALATCYMEGNGVEADTVQAALWCQSAADSGDAQAIELLPTIRTCSFCFSRPARKHCERCRQVRYCDAECQTIHWNRETDPHKSHCRRRAAEASQEEAGCASTSEQ
jgi:TPR repeat protein